MGDILNGVIQGPNKRLITYDLFTPQKSSQAPVIIFCHGYKGFKDWGAWTLLGKAFALNGIAFFKFNFSSNGVTRYSPDEFNDLEAFGLNNYTKELSDLKAILDWFSETYKTESAFNLENITLLGHSRGGGIALITASEDNRISKLVTLSSVSDYKSRFPVGKPLQDWSNTGIYHVRNGRTNQLMPHKYQFYQDFIANEERLTISRAVKSINIPFLIIHGDQDTSVDIIEARKLHSWSQKSFLFVVRGANHVFGAKHPWYEPHLPPYLELVLKKIVQFINK